MAVRSAERPGTPGRPPGDRSGPGAARWIENEGLLRDEGVVFGLSGVEELPETKVDAVRAYFHARIARSATERRALTEERARLERRAEALRARLQALEPLRDPTPARNDGSADANAGAREGPWATGPRATGPRATGPWNVPLVEFGMPAVAAFFIVVWGESRGLLRDVGAFLFLGMLFLVGGRLLPGLLMRTGAELGRHGRERRRRKATRAELTAARDRADTIERRIAAIAERLRATPSPEELEAACEHKIALLRSEFTLARAARGARSKADVVPIPAGEEGAS